jgi:nucleotide-binding universal stress UspA family protein
MITTEQPGDADRRGAVHAYAENHDVDLFLADLPQDLRATRTVIRDLRWLREHLACDSVFLRNRSVGDIDTIVILGTGGPYDPVKLGLAHRIAVAEEARIRFVHVANEEATEAQMRSIAEYHDRLGAVLAVEWDSRIEPHGDLVDSVTELSRGANLVMLGAPSHRFHVVTDLADRIAEAVDCPALLVHTPVHEKTNIVERWVERFIS